MIRSELFDDIYFSAEDGLAETRHVFLQGNNLPAAWAGKPVFTVCETGFGTGLNVLALWDLFERARAPGQRLQIISLEKYPLTPAQIRAALTPWQEEIGARLERLLALYPLRIPGAHRLALAEGVDLTLVFDDVNEALPEMVVPGGVQAWFLDGFAPARNPQMWTETLFAAMARLSSPGAAAASFSAAGVVRRGLAQAGFAVERARGFGRKRDMTIARFTGTGAAALSSIPRHVGIVGAGLAGTSAAWLLRRAGVAVTLYDRAGAFAAGASGNPVGLINPRLAQNKTPLAGFFATGFSLLDQALRGADAQAVGHHHCGSLHFMSDADKERRLRGMAANGGWHPDHARIVDAAEASALAGVALTQEALYLPEAGRIDPAALCRLYARDVEIKTGGYEEACRDCDAVIVASGAGVLDVPGLSWLPVHTVRGQISFLEAADPAFSLRANICHSGYVAATVGGRSAAGSTFQAWRSDTLVDPADHETVMSQMESAVPALAGAFRVTGGRASLRCAARDRVPLIGPAPEQDNIYVNVAHGSHGLVSSLAGSAYIVGLMTQAPSILYASAAAAIAPARILARLRRRGQAWAADESGVTAIEYGLFIAGIALVVAAAFMLMGDSIAHVFSSADFALSTAIEKSVEEE